ncbi:hypothetical protein [Pseudomonas sp. NMI795_08]|uniref:hypothetical protein n=1 Tax=Pseudomonas sp. NMI795_08 TaxID=2903144 RepID=UPI001E646995|nr:hypothetical protein [Pseudomonas sp. NMI795_08]MCE1119065.1 hypothetical protein [Pseudomonas sp. NMI795_08]
MITINREKAEAIVRDRLRLERDPKLAELDIAYVRALEAGADTSAIAEQKKALRDVPERDLSALTLTELAGLTLEQALTL